MRLMLHVVNAARSVRHQLAVNKRVVTTLGCVTCAIIVCVVAAPAHADNAVSVNSQGTADAFVGVSQSIGWRFTVNTTIQITSLGLLDKNNDGLQADHPVAMWDASGAMLASATIHAGAIEPLVDRFRYAALAPQNQVILTPDQTYTIGFFTTPASPNDGFVVFNGTHTMHSALNQVGAQFYSLGSTFAMPDTANPLGSQCFGPGFQFTIVPGPGALPLVLLLAGMRCRRRLAA